MPRSISLAIAMAVLFLLVLVSVQAGEARARANLTEYVATEPNGWMPEGANQTGTAINRTIMALGWNMTKIMGNVGIGNGSLGAFRTLSNEDINYTGEYVMAGDISMGPWDPARITNLTGQQENASAAVNKSDNESAGKKKGGFQMKSTGDRIPGCKDISCGLPKAENRTPASVNKSEKAANETEVNFGNRLDDPYHSMVFGRPVDDLWYEYPHAIPTNSYARLVGVPAPGGGLVNVGIRAISYGY